MDATKRSFPFSKWMKQVDELCEANTGVSVYDLEDQPYRDLYDSGLTPAETWQEISDELGLDFDSDSDDSDDFDDE